MATQPHATDTPEFPALDTAGYDGFPSLDTCFPDRLSPADRAYVEARRAYHRSLALDHRLRMLRDEDYASAELQRQANNDRRQYERAIYMGTGVS